MTTSLKELLSNLRMDLKTERRHIFNYNCVAAVGLNGHKLVTNPLTKLLTHSTYVRVCIGYVQLVIVV